MSDNDFRGYVNYKGVREGYDKGSPAEYDEWLSDDNATDGWENWDEREKAMERAEKEYNRRKKINDRISANEAGIAENRGLIDGMTMNEDGQDAPAGEPVLSSGKSSRAKAGVEAYDSMLREAQAGNFFNNSVAGVKGVLNAAGVETRGPGSGINGNGFGYIDSMGGGKSTFDYDKPSMGPDENNGKSFLNDYKLNLANGLEPANGRGSAVQADKEAQRAHQLAQMPGARTPNTYTIMPGAYQ